MIGARCPICRRPMIGPRNFPTADHIQPRVLGGSDSVENLRILCRRCNQTRAAANHCVGALACALALPGDQPDLWLAVWRSNNRFPRWIHDPR